VPSVLYAFAEFSMQPAQDIPSVIPQAFLAKAMRNMDPHIRSNRWRGSFIPPYYEV